MKIDRSFVSDIATDSDDAAIADAIIALANSMSLSEIAEGVETEQHLECLMAKGCREIQGYWVARPAPPQDLNLLLRASAASGIHGTRSFIRA